VGLGGQGRDDQALGDLRVGQALPDEVEDLALARGELVERGASGGGRRSWATNASMSRGCGAA
jgi:hypothetical protein